MQTYTIRESAEARQLLAQGLWWQCRLPATAATVRPVLTWTKEVASGGHPLPPIGFIADLGHATFSEDEEARPNRDGLNIPNLPMNVVRTYEDHVLGKFYADWTFERARDALKHYAKGRDQARGLAYFVNAFRERARFDTIEVSLGVINALLEVQPEEILTEGYESLRQVGPHPLLADLYESLIQAARRTSEVLGPEDIFDLERKAALEELGQRLAHRQVLRASIPLEAPLPKHKIRPLARRMEVPTRILEEDMYPVGGFTSLSNRGTIESLLHSQLAYMEPDRQTDNPDMFDMLYLMDELLYYSRDENQFLRRRRTFVIALCPDLVETRFKDFELPYQRGVMLLGLLYVLVRKLTEWLSTDALNFHFLLLGPAEAQLANERAILEKLFFEEMQMEVVHFDGQAPAKLAKRCEEWSRKSMVHVLMVAARPPLLEVKDVVVTRLAVNGARPEIGDGTNELTPVEGDDASDAWAHALQQVLMRWI